MLCEDAFCELLREADLVGRGVGRFQACECGVRKTDLGHLGWDSLSKLVCAASIHPVDAWFNLARRRVAGFERGLPTSSNRQRIWHAYGLYDPEMVPKVVAILRFYHNWMLRGRDGKTPAMRIGLARGLIYPRDLFAF